MLFAKMAKENRGMGKEVYIEGWKEGEDRELDFLGQQSPTEVSCFVH